MKKSFFRCQIRRLRWNDTSCEQKLRLASEACMIGGGVSLLASVAVWLGGGGRCDRSERKAIFVGLWVPSLILLSSYLTRKADEQSLADKDDYHFMEELM